MIALTVRPPWSFAIAALGKTIENRVWTTKHRGILAIHAGATFDWRGQRSVAELTGALVIKTDMAAVVAVAELADVHASSTCVRTERLGHLHPEGPYRCSPWAMGGNGGMWHWQLTNIRRLETPVPCKGRLRLWTLPDDVEAAVLAQIGASASESASQVLQASRHPDTRDRPPGARTGPPVRHPATTTRDRNEDR